MNTTTLLKLPENQISSNHLNIEITGIKNKQGQICLSLFNKHHGFPNDGNNAIQTSCIKVTDIKERVTLTNLAPGSYAIAIFHDENNDGILNFNWVGIPTEGFGFSQNPPILKGIPKFKDSAIIVSDSEINIEIKLKYLL